jgi:hypothetical protein
MRIENLRSETAQSKARVAATVIWEDCDRPDQEIYFEASEEYAESLTCHPHAFLVGCVIPAARHGEKRIAIDSEICPELRNGLLRAMHWLRSWYGHPSEIISIETRQGVRFPAARAAERAGSFLSGGIDSLAALRSNRLDFPLSHPYSIKDCLFVHGFDIGGMAGGDSEVESYRRGLAALKPIVEDAGVALIAVHTNIRHLDDDVNRWMYEFHGAALASVAHVLSKRLSRVYIASSNDIAGLEPWGSHPVLDPNFSSAELQLQHRGHEFSRLDKVRLIADWDCALENVRVCTENPPGRLNCGMCEKCVRTMLELLAVGKLSRTPAFQAENVSAELLAASLQVDALRSVTSEYTELIPALEAVGRIDLVAIIQSKFVRLRKEQAREEERDFRGYVKRLDRRYFGATLSHLYKTIRHAKLNQ